MVNQARGVLTMVRYPVVDTHLLVGRCNRDQLRVAFTAFANQFRVHLPNGIASIHHSYGPFNLRVPADLGPPLKVGHRLRP